MDAFHWASNERQRCGKDFTRIKHTCYDVASDWSNIQGSSPRPQPSPREIQLVNVSIVVNLNVTDAITARLRPQTTPNTRPRRATLSEDRPNIRLETVKSTRSARVGDPITVWGRRRRRQMTNVGLPLVERRTSGQRVTVRFSWCPARVGRHNGACPPRKALPPSILSHRHRRCTSGVVAQRRPAAPRQTGSWTWRTVATVARPAHTIERPPPPAITARQVIIAKPKRHPLYTPQRPNASTVHHWRGYLQHLLVPNLRACPVSLSVGWVTHSTKPWLSVHPGCTSATCWRWGPLRWALPCLRLYESGGACRRGRSSPPVNVYDNPAMDRSTNGQSTEGRAADTKHRTHPRGSHGGRGSCLGHGIACIPVASLPPFGRPQERHCWETVNAQT